MSSFEAEKKIEQLVTNDLNPTLSTIDILSSLKLINHFSKEIKDAGDNLTPELKLAQEELKYLQLGASAVQSSAASSQRIGTGLSGAMSEMVYKGIIDNVLNGDKGKALKVDLNSSMAAIDTVVT